MPTFVEAVVVGAGLGLSLAAPPGPILAKLAFEVARGRRLTGFLVGLGATCADMGFFALVAFGVLRVLPDARILGILGFGGVVLMDFLAYAAWKAATHPPATDERGLSGFAGGFALAATSPFNWMWWAASGIPFVGVYGLSLGLGFFTAILAWVAFCVALFSYGSKKVARFEMYVAYTGAVMLAGFGAFLAYHSLGLLI